MVISVGDRLPDATVLRIGEKGPEPVALADLTAGRRVVIFGVPGAFTPTCSSAHVPSFIRTADALRQRGIDEIICVSVNDPHVMKAWGAATGGTEAGILFLADADSSFTTALGMQFTAPGAGYFNRSKRYSLAAEDGEVKFLNVEEQRGGCEISAGETLVQQLG